MPRRYRHLGPRPIDDRDALAGIAFLLKVAFTWNQLPSALVVARK